MPPTRSKKEKILALLTVVFLFLCVGGLLWSISLKNKKETERLRNIVLKQLIETESREKLTKLSSDDSFLSEIKSKSYLTIAMTNGGMKKILNQKNPDLILPIASVTKLMVAVVVLENADLNTEITATLDYIGKEESAFVLETDKKYTIKELLANALISSDNDSARLLSSIFGEKKFIEKMNTKAQELKLNNTNYINITGLDPIKPTEPLNTSSASDLAKLLIYIKNKHPDILKITTNASYNFCDTNNFCKTITSTNKLLGSNVLSYPIIGGKTGSTDLAGKNLVLLTEFTPEIYFISIVLGSEDSFLDTTTLINNIKIEK